jgi:hypothetical protein
MRLHAIIFPSPALDKNLRFRQRVQHLAIEKLIFLIALAVNSAPLSEILMYREPMRQEI